MDAVNDLVCALSALVLASLAVGAWLSDHPQSPARVNPPAYVRPSRPNERLKMSDITQTVAATYGGAAVGKVLGRLGCGGDMHYNPGECHQYTPPVVLEIKIGEEVALKVPITGFDLTRQQAGQHGTRISLLANESS